MGSAKCSVCGRTYSESGSFLGGNYGNGVAFLASAVKKPICPDCKRAGAFSGGGNGEGANTAASQESAANAKLAEAQAKALEKQTEAEERARKKAEKAAFAESMSNITFNGDADEISKDFEIIYQYWLDKDLDSSQKKIIKDKLELGMMALKKADSVKAEFYEKKINDEKKKRKIKKIVKAVGITVGVIALFLLMIGLANQ